MLIENSLWVEKHRPKSLEQYIGNEDVVGKVRRWLDQGDIPSILLSGKAGTGKTSLAKIIGRHLDCDILYLNASDENNVDSVRDKIKGFASTFGSATWKLVILDESDFLTASAQAALRQVIEAFSKHCRFVLTCNYVERIIDPIQSRCVHFNIHPPSKKEVAKRCVQVLKEEEVVFDKETLLQIINDTYPDIRRTINSLQRNSIDGKLQLDESAKLVSNYMEKILEELKSFKDAKSSFQNIRQIIADSRVRTFDDLYRFLYDNLETFVTDGKRAMAILQIAESQYRAAFAVDKEIETMALFVNLIKILA